MTWKELLDNGWFVRVVLVLWLVSAVFVVFLLGRVDWIVHHELYNFGLQFSPEWAFGYWAMVRAIYVFLAAPLVLSAVYLGLEMLRFVKGRRGVVKPKPLPRVKPTRQRVAAVEQNHMVISCPKCKRVFSKPLVMLDFSTGKSRLVNVCPYCNYVLSWGEDTKKEDVGIVDLEEKKLGIRLKIC